MRAMQLILPDGRVLEGADAVPELLQRIPRWRWAASLLALPGARPVARRAYAWIAANRMRISCAVNDEGAA
jgi:predicted DCC family thiol-disulfide oxidoreductase YuxK